MINFTNPLLSLRPIKDDDKEVLFKIYASTRNEELAVTGWSSLQKEIFLHQQFTAQHIYYQNNYTGANFWVIVKNKKTVGRLYLHPDYAKRNMRIIDISLLPAFRNKGIGSGILKDILKFSYKAGKAVSIHVESINPAMNLYERLGFKQKSITNGVYHLMEFKATTLVTEPV